MSDVTIVVENTVEANVTVSNKSPLTEVPDGFFTLAMLPTGLFTADDAGRGKFASGFVNSALCAAGLWSSLAPTGAVLQTVTASTATMSTISATIPFDDTKPQITEGTQIFSASITPMSTSNKVRVRFGFTVGRYVSTNPVVTAAVFSGAADAIYAVYQNVNASGQAYFGEFIDSPATATAKTYSLRVGPHGGETLYINGYYGLGPRALGGASIATFTLEEIKG